jgi:hypothetical protein
MVVLSQLSCSNEGSVFDIQSNPSHLERTRDTSAIMKLLTVAFTLFSPLVNGLLKPETCRCFPGDACWPSDETWSALNTTVGGRLIKTVPLGKPCHGIDYEDAECKALASVWKKPTVQ